MGTCDIGAYESQGFSFTRTGGNLQSAPVNAGFANPLLVTLAEIGGSPLPGSLVTFTGPSMGASTAPATFTATTDTSGVASAVATANGTPGAYIITASAGGSNNLEFFLTNTKAAASISLTSSPNPSNYKERVTFTAMVSGAAGTPTGRVTFYENVPTSNNQP